MWRGRKPGFAINPQFFIEPGSFADCKTGFKVLAVILTDNGVLKRSRVLAGREKTGYVTKEST